MIFKNIEIYKERLDRAMKRAYNALATSNEQRATSNEQRARNIRFWADNDAALFSHVMLNIKRHSAAEAMLSLSDGVLRI